MAVRLRSPALALLLALGACAKASAPECVVDPSAPPLDATTVCTHLDAIRCTLDHDDDSTTLDACLEAYTNAALTMESGAFARTTHCYVAARSCRQVTECSLACPAIVVDSGPSSSVDSGLDSGLDADSDAAP